MHHWPPGGAHSLCDSSGQHHEVACHAPCRAYWPIPRAVTTSPQSECAHGYKPHAEMLNVHVIHAFKDKIYNLILKLSNLPDHNRKPAVLRPKNVIISFSGTAALHFHMPHLSLYLVNLKNMTNPPHPLITNKKTKQGHQPHCWLF